MANQKLVEFIKEARRRGFGDITIRDSLVNHGWPVSEVERGFAALIPRQKLGNPVMLYLDNELISLLEKRAKKNIFTLPEQIEDILRRSVLSQKQRKSPYDPKLDDTLVSLFSRRNTGRKKK